MLDQHSSKLADDCKRYIQELNQSYATVSNSHETLRVLYCDHGRAVVDQWLDNYWREQRRQHAN